MDKPATILINEFREKIVDDINNLAVEYTRKNQIQKTIQRWKRKNRKKNTINHNVYMG